MPDCQELFSKSGYGAWSGNFDETTFNDNFGKILDTQNYKTWLRSLESKKPDFLFNNTTIPLVTEIPNTSGGSTPIVINTVINTDIRCPDDPMIVHEYLLRYNTWYKSYFNEQFTNALVRNSSSFCTGLLSLCAAGKTILNFKNKAKKFKTILSFTVSKMLATATYFLVDGRSNADIVREFRDLKNSQK